MSARGFTLVEVLVALAIVTAGMAAVLSALTSAADTGSYLRDKTFAEWIALNRIVEVRWQAKPPPAGKETGTTEFAGRRWEWEQETLEMPQVPGMLRIDVGVRPMGAARDQKGGWYTTVVGMVGDAVAAPSAQSPYADPMTAP